MIVLQYLAAMLIGYIIGSIPFGLIIARKTTGVDVRQWGSGKTGTTNVLRTAGKKAAILVAALDIMKGAVPAVLAGLIVGRNYLMIGNFGFGALLAQVLAAVAAIAGHNWSVFLRFRGGSGVATFFGGWVGLFPMVGLFGGGILLIGAGLTRFVSLGSMAGVVGTYAIMVPLTVLNGWPIEYLLYSLVGTVFIIYTHRGNIVRLFNGKERRLGEKAGKAVLEPVASGRKRP